jgi:uncharacterized protein (TIGR03000 family)
MKLLPRLALGLFVLVALTASTVGQEKTQSTLTILVPEKGHAETVVKVNGKKVDGKGGQRVYRATVEKDQKATLTVEALIEPNNYTKITRKKTVVVGAGEDAKVDLRQKDPENDKIVVRWVPTPDDIVDRMCQMAKVGKNDVVYDLGCGDAVMLIRPIQKFGAKKGIGIDIDPKMIAKSKEKAKKAGLADRIELRVGDILNVDDLSDASVVLIYIGDDLGERVGLVLKKTLRPGARIVSHRFRLGDWEPTRTVNVAGKDGSQYQLHLWVVGERQRGEKN